MQSTIREDASFGRSFRKRVSKPGGHFKNAKRRADSKGFCARFRPVIDLSLLGYVVGRIFVCFRFSCYDQKMSQAQATQSHVALPGQELTLEETLRVMDVAREMREQREKAEEMFRRDDIRSALRDKLMRTARMSGDNVTEDEIDAAIRQYMDTLHTYEDPRAGFKNFIAHCWIWRDRILFSAAGLAAAAGGLWYFFG